MSVNIDRILQLGRWAPSGDNTQPWAFEVIGDDHLVVHGRDTRDHCVYDLEGRASQIAIGALIETLAIAATQQGYTTEVSRRRSEPEDRPLFDLRFRQAKVTPDPLINEIERRSVQRRALSTSALTSNDKTALEAAVAPLFTIRWLEGFQARARATRLVFDNAKLRLTLPEAYPVHKSIIEWGAQFSEDRIPERAVGVDRLTGLLMRWVLGSWDRVKFFNRFLAGTWLPRVQLELIPGFACAAHALLIARQPPLSIDDYLSGGRALQRFWLTNSALGLEMQPEVTPLIFSRYVRDRIPFTTSMDCNEQALSIRNRLLRLADNADHAVFMMRVGRGRHAHSRSLRRSVQHLSRV